jgi:hypothetical protein
VAAGGFVGDWMLSHAHPYAPLVPAVVTAVVIAIAWVALKPRATLCGLIRVASVTEHPYGTAVAVAVILRAGLARGVSRPA